MPAVSLLASMRLKLKQKLKGGGEDRRGAREGKKVTRLQKNWKFQ